MVAIQVTFRILTTTTITTESTSPAGAYLKRLYHGTIPMITI